MTENIRRPYVDSHSDKIAFPVLCPGELEQLAEFGERCTFAAGETLFSAGDPLDCFVILSGNVTIFDVSTDERACMVKYEAGYFSGDIDLFTGRGAAACCEADNQVEAIRISATRIRELFTRRPSLGDRFWKAFQRRRELMLDSAFEGWRVYGKRRDPLTLDTVEFLFRNGVPHHWMDIGLPENVARLKELSTAELRYPVLTYGKKLVFQAPTRVELADRIGLRRCAPREMYDVLIVGAGPAGLGAAVYGASEGLSTLVLDAMGPGGQAGSSSKIENYAGFPNGIPGRELAQLTYLQALKFGAEFVAPSHATGFRRQADGLYEVETSEGDKVKSKSIIVATGVSYRLLDVEGLEALQGAGIFYNATKIEASLCEDEPVHVVGAGNSAGQAAMFLSQFSRQVCLLVRGDDLNKSMSSYLVNRVRENKKITVHYRSEVVAIEGVERIEAVRFRTSDGSIVREETAGLFIFIGAKPMTDYLPKEMSRDEKGYLLTGRAVQESANWKEMRPPLHLETSLPGVFASGDCRSGTTKRVAFSIGDGAFAVSCVHEFLATLS